MVAVQELLDEETLLKVCLDMHLPPPVYANCDAIVVPSLPVDVHYTNRIHPNNHFLYVSSFVKN